MELIDGNSDLMTVEETVRVLHVPAESRGRPMERTRELGEASLASSGEREPGTRSNKRNSSNFPTFLENDFEPLLTAEEAAMHLRIHPKTLQKMARAGQVPCMRRGKYWFFRLSSLDVWLRAQENRCSQPFCVKRSGDCLESHA
jgi:excisionase family DNA binding protein